MALSEHATPPEAAVPVAPVPAPLAPPRSVTFRAVALALLLMPLNAYWVVQMESVRYSAHPTTISLFFNCIFILVVLTGLNGLVTKVRPRWAMAQGELLLVYSMLCIGSCLAGHDMMQVLAPILVWPFALATPSNGYTPLFGRFLPGWAMMTDTDAGKGFFTGHDTLYTRAHLLAWAPPVLVWTAFVLVLLFVMQCVNTLIRQQWAENERLSFPLTRIPLEITDAQPFGRGRSGRPLTKNRLFWIGFALAAFIDLVNSLNYYYPNIPPILAPGHGQSVLDLSPFVTAKPWSAIGWTPLTFYPFMLGLGMLMPMDFLFSSWFFYLFWKLQSVLIVAGAWDSDARMPYANYQALGAYLLFFASTLWLSRTYFKRVARRALGLATDISDAGEPLSYRGAFLGLALGLALLIGFSVALGMSWWLAVAFFVIYLALALAITRMRAELGTPVHDLHYTGPDLALTDLFGPATLGPQNLSILTLFFWFNRAYRPHPMPHQLEAFRMAEQTGAMRGARGEMHRWFWALLLAGGFGMLCAFWAMLHASYVYGATAKMSLPSGSECYDRLSSWLRAPQPANRAVPAAVVIGFLFALFLQAMRVRFAWWPFHPLAYAVSGSWEMNLLWMPLFLAWLVKTLLLRYGGMRMYQTSLPFFYGLILGQFLPGSVLNIWGILSATPTYQFWQ